MIAPLPVGNRPTVLIGFGESFAAIEAAWSLQRSGMNVVAFTREGSRPPIRYARDISVHQIPKPEADLTSATDALSTLIDVVRPNALLPLDDASLWMSRRVTVKDCTVVGPDQRGVDFALNKASQIREAAAAGISVPATAVFEQASLAHSDSWPVIVKPADAVRQTTNRLVRPNGRICASADELLVAGGAMGDGPVLVQDLITGRGEGLFGYAGADGPVSWSAHRRIRMVNPHGSASSACESIPVDPYLQTAVAGMLRRLNWRGLFMVEFLRDESGTAWFMELNGRAWGSLALARRRGFEYPAWAVQDAIDLPQFPVPPANPPHATARHIGREIGHMAFVVRGPQSSAATAWPGIGQTVRQLATLRRTDHVYNWDSRQPRVLASDTWQSLTGLIHGRKRARA
jgi:hypothetical protein